MGNRQQGYTIIELMIIMTVIGVLASLALAAYKDYLARAQMAEAMMLASGAKPNIAEFTNNIGHYPLSNISAGLALPQSIVGTYVSSVSVFRGVITAQIRRTNVAEGIKGTVLVLSPYTSTKPGSYEWTCTSTAAPKYLPEVCRN